MLLQLLLLVVSTTASSSLWLLKALAGVSFASGVEVPSTSGAAMKSLPSLLSKLPAVPSLSPGPSPPGRPIDGNTFHAVNLQKEQIQATKDNKALPLKWPASNEKYRPSNGGLLGWLCVLLQSRVPLIRSAGSSELERLVCKL